MSKISVDTLKNTEPIRDIKEFGITDESVAQLFLLLTDDTYKVSAEEKYFFNKSDKIFAIESLFTFTILMFLTPA